MEVQFELNGKSSLLMHADDIIQADSLDEWRKDPKNKGVSKSGDDRSPVWTWHSYLYDDGKNIVIPSVNLMVCLRQAGARKILKKQTTFKEVTQSGMSILEEFLEFRVKDKQIDVKKIQALRDRPFKEQFDTVKDFGFRLFMKRAKIGNAKHVRVRPRFDTWTVRGNLSVVAKELTFEVLEELFDLAGNVGLGDWRPGCKTPGSFGMFTSKLKLV